MSGRSTTNRYIANAPPVRDVRTWGAAVEKTAVSPPSGQRPQAPIEPDWQRAGYAAAG
jgi:hypothetical protein